MKKAAKELRSKTITQLEGEEKTLRNEMAKMKLEYKMNPPKDVNTLFKKKKRLAVLLTLLTEKKELEKLEKEIK